MRKSVFLCVFLGLALFACGSQPHRTYNPEVIQPQAPPRHNDPHNL